MAFVNMANSSYKLYTHYIVAQQQFYLLILVKDENFNQFCCDKCDKRDEIKLNER